MKPQKPFYTAIGLLLFFLLCLVPNGEAQSCVPLSQPASAPWQLGQVCTFTSASGAYGAISAKGILFWKIASVPNGTISAASLSVDSSATGLASSWSIGGIIPSATIGSLTAASLYQNTSTTTPTNFVQLTPSITGTGTLTVTVLGFVNAPTDSGGGGVASAVTQSGTWNVGQSGSWTVQPGNIANTTAWLVTGSGGTFPVTGTFWQTTQPVSLATAPTTPVTGTFWQTTQPVSVASAPTTPIQPAGFGTLIGFQQAVTATAVALASNSSHSFCVEALSANTISVYVGPSGVTTSSGAQLQPGQSICWTLSNTNLVYVIASTTGASVAVTGT
jgi:hypothetical protein